MTDTQLATTNKSPIIVLRERLEERRQDLKNALPDDISPDRFIRSVIVSAQINPDILACSWQSVWLACMRACRDGLIPDGVEAAIVQFKSTASYIPMYQGLLRNFRRSGRFKWVTAGLVRQGEEFAHWIDEGGEHFKHVPGDAFSAPILRIYAMATTKDGGIFVTVIPIEEANKMRNMSRATRDDAPWKIWPEEMYKKTALRRLSKMLPTARDGTGINIDDDELADAVTTLAGTSGPPAGIARESGAAAALAHFAGPSPAAGTFPSPASASEADATAANPAVTADPPQNEQPSQHQPKASAAAPDRGKPAR
jgi:recombination protein RecT